MFDQCMPGGVISPEACPYLTSWWDDSHHHTQGGSASSLAAGLPPGALGGGGGGAEDMEDLAMGPRRGLSGASE